MLAYPGYTVQKIKDELTWREVEELAKTWKDHPPTFFQLNKIEQILEKHTGVKFQKMQPTDNELLSKLKEMSWL